MSSDFDPFKVKSSNPFESGEIIRDSNAQFASMIMCTIFYDLKHGGNPMPTLLATFQLLLINTVAFQSWFRREGL